MLGNILRFSGLLLAGSAAVLWMFGERWRLIRRSTLTLMGAQGWREMLNAGGLHGYVYGRWTKQYLDLLINHIIPRLSPGGRKWLADHYHGKVLTPDQAQAIIALDKPIPLQDLEQIIPYPTARDLVLTGPPDVAVYECNCRAVSEHPCQPTQVCMVIGQPFVDFMVEHHPRGARRISQAEALDLLAAEHERGHMHSAWFKDVMLDRFYALCNCCKCCCGGIKSMTKYGSPSLAASGFVSTIDAELCSACGTCVEACPFGALALDEAVAVRDWDKCMGCGVCVDQCPNEAISLVRDEGKGLPLDVRLLARAGAETRTPAGAV